MAPEGITDLYTPTARGAMLFVDRVPHLAGWALEFAPSCWNAGATNPWPARAQRVGQLLEWDQSLTPHSKEAGRLLLEYYSTCGLVGATAYLISMIIIIVISVGLIIGGLFFSLWALIIGVLEIIWAVIWLIRRCVQGSKANELWPRINSAIQAARAELGLPAVPGGVIV